MAYRRTITVATTFVLASFCASQANALFGPSNYSECVLDNLSAEVSAKAVVYLEAECRKTYPEASTSFFTPESMQQCYDENKDLASSRVVAKAIYRACNDYNYRPSQVLKKPSN
jgi:hypothetical protein